MTTLVILAAGSARRFARLKQIEPVGPGGETFIEYAISDALTAGFTRAVLVIRAKQEPMLRAALDARLSAKVELAYAHQLPPPGAAPRDRPWGTGHAVLCARGSVQGAFGVINADDYYGPAAYVALSQFLARPRTTPPTFGLVSFALADTLPEKGAVNRAICECTSDGRLLDIRETTQITRGPGGAVYTDSSGHAQRIDDATHVSMNMWAFDDRIFELLDAEFRDFLDQHRDSSDAEFALVGSPGTELEFAL